MGGWGIGIHCPPALHLPIVAAILPTPPFAPGVTRDHPAFRRASGANIAQMFFRRFCSVLSSGTFSRISRSASSTPISTKERSSRAAASFNS